MLGGSTGISAYRRQKHYAWENPETNTYTCSSKEEIEQVKINKPATSNLEWDVLVDVHADDVLHVPAKGRKLVSVQLVSLPLKLDVCKEMRTLLSVIDLLVPCPFT